MRAPDAVKNSPLAIQEGPLAAGGWLDVDKGTLQHRRYPNVFGIGDINGTARGKTAATIKKSAPLVVHNLLRHIAGRRQTGNSTAIPSCPLLIREGSALLVEFDYEGRLTPLAALHRTVAGQLSGLAAQIPHAQTGLSVGAQGASVNFMAMRSIRESNHV